MAAVKTEFFCFVWGILDEQVSFASATDEVLEHRVLSKEVIFLIFYLLFRLVAIVQYQVTSCTLDTPMIVESELLHGQICISSY